MQIFQVIVLFFFVLIHLAFAGLSIGSGGHHKSSHDIQIKGPIGDGYIYPVKNKHQQKSGGHGGGHGGSGSKAQTYKLIIQNAGSNGGSSHHQQLQQQPTQVKTFKVIKQSSSASSSGHGHGNSVKTIKLIHVKGGDSSCSNSGHGWQ